MSSETSKPRTKATPYTEQFKLTVIEEYLRTGMSKEYVQKKYGIKANSAIYRWMQALGYMDPYENNRKLEEITEPEMSKKQTPSRQLSELEIRIKLLEKRLEDEQIRAEMYKRMIDIAEERYKISIRKNSNTK